MKAKTFSLTVIAGTIALLLIFAAGIYMIDPFCQYHMPINEMKPVFSRGTQNYLNPGLAKNSDYNSVVLGSSVSENFYASQFSKVFDCNAIKLPSAGGYSTNYKEIMTVVFREKKIKNVFFSLDEFALWNDPEKPNQELPLYLYDTNPLNDVSYLLNKSSLNYVYDMIRQNHSGTAIDYDKAYNWQNEFTFSKERTLKYYQRPELHKTNSKNKYIKKFGKNLENITTFIEGNPDTTFYIFLPPYSIIWWDGITRDGNLDAVLNALTVSMKQLAGYKNVKLFYFQNIPEIKDLDNYRERMHFTETMNAEMVVDMNKNKYRVTEKDVDKVLADMKKTVKKFDFSVFFPENK